MMFVHMSEALTGCGVGVSCLGLEGCGLRVNYGPTTVEVRMTVGAWRASPGPPARRASRASRHHDRASLVRLPARHSAPDPPFRSVSS